MDNTGCPYPKGGETGGVGGPRPRRARCGRAERLVGAGRGSERTRRKRAEVGISKLRWCMRGAVKERAGAHLGGSRSQERGDNWRHGVLTRHPRQAWPIQQGEPTARDPHLPCLPFTRPAARPCARHCRKPIFLQYLQLANLVLHAACPPPTECDAPSVLSSPQRRRRRLCLAGIGP